MKLNEITWPPEPGLMIRSDNTGVVGCILGGRFANPWISEDDKDNKLTMIRWEHFGESQLPHYLADHITVVTVQETA